MQPEVAALTARQLAELHRVAQERLGLTGALAAYEAWQDINLTTPVLTVEMVNAVLDIAHSLRKVSRALSARYYNLVRALGSGYAYPDINGRFPTNRVTLSLLFDSLAESLNEVTTSTTLDFKIPAKPAPADTQAESDDRTLDERLDDLGDALIEMFQELLPEASEDLLEQIIIEEDWDWADLDEPDEDTLDEDLLAEIEDQAVQELSDIVEKEFRSDRSMAESMARIEDRANARGAVVAALVDADIIAPGRRLTFAAGNRDPRRYAWMRVTGPKPCGFCAMLASRGAVYDTAESAGYGNLYHPNCHCHQVPVFIQDPHYSRRDEYFIDSWGPVTKGYSGRGALRVWRKWLTQQYREGLVPDADLFGPAVPA